MICHMIKANSNPKKIKEDNTVSIFLALIPEGLQAHLLS